MIAKTNLVRDIIDVARERLLLVYDEQEAASIVRTLMEERFGISRVDISLQPKMVLTESQIVQVHKDLKKLLDGIPVQYILGYSYFMGIKLFVNKDVLIPRPETEELVNELLSIISEIPNPKIIDIGTGSGAIAIALKRNRPDSTVYATDISKGALEAAEKNAKDLLCEIKFIQHDILTSNPPIRTKVDVIISNPPYIPRSEAIKMHVNVINHEPETALFVDDADPLLFYRQIGESGKIMLQENGVVVFETHHLYAQDVKQLIESMNYRNVTIKRDIHGKPRIVIAHLH